MEKNLTYITLFSLIVILIAEYLAKGSLRKLLYLNPLYILLTIITSIILMLPILVLSQDKTWLFMIFYALGMLILGIANKIKIDYRQNGFTPIDLLIIKEATSMSGALNKRAMAILFVKFFLAFAGLMILAFWLKGQTAIINFNFYFVLAAGILLLIFYIVAGPRFNFRLNVYKTGVLIFFLSYFRDPVKLDKRKVKTMAKTVPENIKDELDTGEKPDIIIIQSESFSDPTILGLDNFNQDPLPYFHRLKNEVYSFNMSTRAFGGGTVNTEFEIITGLSTVFFPRDTTVFSRYIKRPLPSIASILKKQGYSSVLIHPYESWYYNRVKTYHNLGFDKFISNKGFKNHKNRYVSDEAVSKKILESLDKGYKLVFAVTMQNHTPYDQVTANHDIRYLGQLKNKETKEHFNNYLSGLKATDDSLKELITVLKARKKNTILLFYGDHLPIINQDPDFYSNISWTKSKLASKEYYHDLSISPGFIWTNYDSKTQNTQANIDSTMVIYDLLKESKLAYPEYLSGLHKLFIEEKISSFHRDFLFKEEKLFTWDTFEYQEFYKKVRKINSDVFSDNIYKHWSHLNNDYKWDQEAP